MSTVFVILFGSFTLTTQTNWCSLVCTSSGNTEENTMCKYKSQTAGNGCTDIKPSMTLDKRIQILSLHNEYRNLIAGGQIPGWPQAGNMRQMTWDNDLEIVAQRWAVQCQPGHDKCRRTTAFEYVGQNYGMAGSTGSPPAVLNISFKGWVNEISQISPSILSSFQSTPAGHFTQVVWAESFKLGCAEITYNSASSPGMMNGAIICNYGPGGNIVTKEVYKSQKSCGACPEGTKCRPPLYQHLCAFPNDPVDPNHISASPVSRFQHPVVSTFYSALLFYSLKVF